VTMLICRQETPARKRKKEDLACDKAPEKKKKSAAGNGEVNASPGSANTDRNDQNRRTRHSLKPERGKIEDGTFHNIGLSAGAFRALSERKKLKWI